ncbi:MAG TPA: hypothetical protein VMD05_04760 [Candidatus Nanoarchaeia archaeon]|nr:hypothetical protein [Candidatus Nanoarchaeia archaeon]
MQSMDDLKEKIRSLEAERLRLRSELDNLKRTAENRAAALEGDVSAMREELNELREILGPNVSSNTLPSRAVQDKQVIVGTPVIPEAPVKELLPSTLEHASDTVPAKTTLDSVMDNLNEDELKVVKILQGHDGKYPQKAIRAEAKLSWLQANRVITHLNELSVISFEKDGPIENVVLVEELKK